MINLLPNNPFSCICLADSLAKGIFHPTTQRVANIALPFLSLYGPTAILANTAAGGLKTWHHGKEVIQYAKNKKWALCAYEATQLALSVLSIAVSILKYRTGLIVLTTQELAVAVHQLGTSLLKGHYKDALAASSVVVYHSMQLVTVLTGSPYLIAASMLFQIAIDAKNSLYEFKQGRYLEGVAHLILGALHGKQLHQQIEEIRDLYSTFEVTPEAFQELTEKDVKALVSAFARYKEGNKKVNFKTFLQEHGYSSHLKGANFSKVIKNSSVDSASSLFTEIDFSDTCFTECNFESLDLNHSQFKQSGIFKCNFNKTALDYSHFVRCEIDGASFNYARLIQSKWVNSKIIRSTFNYAKWVNAHLFNLKIQNSSFKEASLISSRIEDCTISFCNLISTIFKNTSFKEAFFNSCDLRDSSFNGAVLKFSAMDKCCLDYASFHDAKMHFFEINQSSLIAASFLDASIWAGILNKCDLIDCLLFEAACQFTIVNCTENRITRPIVGICWNVATPGFTTPKVYHALKTFDMIPLRLEHLDDSIDIDQLYQEVQTQLHHISEGPPNPGRVSIATELLDRAANSTKQIAAIQKRAQRYVSYLDALLLPGGNDIEPEFYGHAKAVTTSPDPDYRRSIFEFAAIEEARKRGIFILGICRGCQMLSVSRDGTLNQNVEGHWGYIQEYEVKEGLIKTLTGDKIKGVSTHHQAIDRVGKGLEVKIEYQGIPKAIEGKNEIGLQFHPERCFDGFDISKENENFFTYLARQGRIHRGLEKKQQAYVISAA